MRPTSPSRGRPKKRGTISSILLLLTLLSLLLSACGTPANQQKAIQNKTDLDQQISDAKKIGVPDTLLQTIITQEKKLSQSNAPMTLFSDQPANDYYSSLATRYHMLSVQVKGLKDQATQQLDYQAAQDMNSFSDILAQRQAQGFVEAKTFADQLAQARNQMAQAQYPKDYTKISSDAKDSTEALRLMGSAYDKLTSFQDLIKQLQSSKVDTSALEQQNQSDLQLFRSATTATDFSKIITQLNAQLQGTATLSTQSIPYVGAAKLKEFGAAITEMKKYNMDASKYQQQLDSDTAALDKAKTLDDFLKFSSQVDNDIASSRIPMLQGEAKYLVQQFHQEVDNWGNTNMYHNPFDNKDYKLDYEYGPDGNGNQIGADLDAAANSAQTSDDFQAVITLAKNDMTNLQAMEADYKDSTGWDQVHKTDTDLMNYYNTNTGTVLVVSLIEQTTRVYQDGKLIKAFQVVSGRYEKASPPGFWHINWRVSPTVFKSGEKPGDAFYYPDTPIKYAMQYHDGGYFFHDSTWRVVYGVGANRSYIANLPHYDPGDPFWAGNGSHGCMNMALSDVGWLYQNTGYGTSVIIY